MTTTLDRTPTRQLPANGGIAARRAVVRWAWRLLRQEWRQQLLILALIVVAVVATIVGGAVATNSRQPSNFGFGTAQNSATFQGLSPHVISELSTLRHRFGTVEVIENQTFTIPGSINTYQLRAESAAGPFSPPMLALLSGHYPIGPDEVAVTSGVASSFHLGTGDLWRAHGTTRRVVGIVQNPQSLLDGFALVAPGQVENPTQVTALFDAHGASIRAIGPTVQTPASAAQANVLNPETISLAALVLGMLLIALVSIGGFTVLAQRRLRSIGMLESLGATDRHVSLVVRANGALVGLVGAVVGFGVSLVVWLAYRPTLEQSSHHTIGIWALPWLVVALSVALAVITTYFAASRPARAITKLPIMAALSGRPAPPRQVHRSAIPGVVLLVVAFLLLGYSGSTNGNGSGTGELLLGLVALIPGLILLSPFLLSLVARAAGRAPIAPRLALRDLARYRARSGSALSAISIGVLIAVIVSLAAAARYGNVLDYAGPNLSSNQLALQSNTPPPAGSVIIDNGRRSVAPPPSTPVASPAALAMSAQHIAAALGAQSIPLESPDAQINHVGSGRSWDGQIYVATPQLLKAFGIKESQIQPDADFLTARPGLSGVTGLYLAYGSGEALGSKGGGNGPANGPGPGPRNGPGPGPLNSLSGCSAATDCLANPVFQELSALPAGTSAPNTVITEHAMRQFHLQASTSNWLVQRAEPFTAAQISRAQLTASTAQLSVESKNDQPSSSQIINWATVFGIALALGILAMSIGLIRSETASDLRTLTAAGASSSTRRTLTAVTAGALGFLGALLGTVGGYIALIGWLRSNSLNGGISSLANIPITNLLVILVGMPLVATIFGWLLAGRQPSGVARQPMD
jgi:putative ABC transport system permease protein